MFGVREKTLIVPQSKINHFGNLGECKTEEDWVGCNPPNKGDKAIKR